MQSVIKITFAMALVASLVSATPIPCAAGTACSHSVPESRVNLKSVVDVVPETNIIPVTRLQPYIESLAPIIHSEGCGVSLYDHGGPDYGRDFTFRGEGSFGGDGGRMYGTRFRKFKYGHRGSRMSKRDKMITHSMKGGMEVECIPTAANAYCETNVAPSTTTLGSSVNLLASDSVEPSAVYAPRVQAKAPTLEAAPESHQSLAKEKVNLGGVTNIVPETHVQTETLYRPSVDSKATVVEVEAPKDQTLPSSSVSLGSLVSIRPVTNVTPLTTFAQTIKSLPFIIHQETACDQQEATTSVCSC